MAKIKAFLVKRQDSRRKDLLSKIAYDYCLFEDNHQIYVPGKFILGNLIESKQGFNLRPGGILYRDDPKVLESYQKYIDQEVIEVVQELFVSKNFLEKISSEINNYIFSRDGIKKKLKKIDKYRV